MKIFQKIFKRSAQSPEDILTLIAGGSDTNSGMTVNTSTAQALPAVYCAVNTIADAVSNMPIHVYKRDSLGEKERQRSHIVERLLNISPNGYQTAYDFKVAMMRSALLTGNAFAEIVYDNAGRVSRLIPLHPNEVNVKKLKNYRVGYQITVDGKPKPLQQEQMLHIRVNSDDGVLGKSPIAVCRESIGLELSAQRHGADFFKNGIAPFGGLRSQNTMKTEQYERLKESISSYSTQGGKFKPMILEGGLEWQPISISNEDAEWLASRQFGVAEIARMFKISPIFIMDYSNSTYSNFSEASKAFLQQTLKPWLTNIELAVLTKLIPEVKQDSITIEFETKDMLRTTAKERFEIYDIAIRNGLMNPDECRRAENMQPRAGGEQYSQSWLQQTKAAEQAKT
ncbi:MAG: phage portal protein [Aestuariibacter sp.]|nr:phage portal protein [Aestuariibacter sp.]MAP21758.1 phage portal protein [Alteromonadaceae bacterium]MAX41524.1 phage portal protein [Alteromonadaceae bacterium]|tara:strand:+ start:10331 stop:11521 length:1191 start_codon:yes stop_codon:yes gene_type:complete